MKRAVIVCVIVLLAVSATATDVKRPNFYMGGGVGVSTGTTNAKWNLGLHGQFGIGMWVSPIAQVIPIMAYNSFALDSKGTTASGGGLSVMMLGVDVKFNLSNKGQKTVPYFFGGTGIGIRKIDGASVPGLFGNYYVRGSNQTRVYSTFGAGLDIVTSPKSAIFFAVRYVNVYTPGSAATFIPITVGLRLWTIKNTF